MKKKLHASQIFKRSITGVWVKKSYKQFAEDDMTLDMQKSWHNSYPELMDVGSINSNYVVIYQLQVNDWAIFVLFSLLKDSKDYLLNHWISIMGTVFTFSNHESILLIFIKHIQSLTRSMFKKYLMVLLKLLLSL